jgi:hypothetical protein
MLSPNYITGAFKKGRSLFERKGRLGGIKFQNVEIKNQQNPDGAGAYSLPNPV